MDELKALEAFTGSDDGAARQAFDYLFERGRRFLFAYFRNTYPELRARNDHIEDIIQEIFVRIWGVRSKFQNRGVAAWYTYLKRIAENCRVDMRPIEVTLPEDGDPEPRQRIEGGTLDELLRRLLVALKAGKLHHLANVIWLGLDPALPARTHERQLLGAQYYYLDGLPWHEIQDMLPPVDPEEPPLTRERLDTWLAHPGVLRYLAYTELYYSNDRLAGCLLGLGDSDNASTLDMLLRQATTLPEEQPGPGGWTWPEIAILLLRYRYALLNEQILLRVDGGCTQQQLRALFVRSAARLPFNDIMATLLARLSRAPAVPGKAILGTSDLWKRLAFQYCYHEELPHRDIQERLQPAAQQVGFTVTLPMLNGWLSQCRLLERLKQRFQESESPEENR